jgi:uncharacterized delta-60 repeat protein
VKRKSRTTETKLVFEELEPRVLLSADPLAVVSDSGVDAVHEQVIDNNEFNSLSQQSSTEHNQVQLEKNRNELVIIDSRAPNYQQLHNDLIKAQQQGRNVHVVVLDAHRDGIEQINEALASHNNLDAVHIVSHGDDGQLQLGATQLNKTSLHERASDINGWKGAFDEAGDMLIYGCSLAESEDGRELVDALGKLTATDVAASDDLTGNSLLGGDWELEYEAGDIETEIAFSDQLQDDWQGTLDATAQAAAEEQQAEEEQQQQEAQQEQQAQAELEAQQAALKEEEQAAAKQEDGEQETAITQEQRQEIVIIDESVADFQSFIDDLQSNSDPSTTFEIVLLDNTSDGVERINEILSAYQDVDALHIVSHGDDGAVQLGGTWLNADNLEQYSDSLSAWGNALDVNADLLIYGCNLAESAQGEQFIERLAQLTGADVAASDDLTGNANLGGDWELEYVAGDVETEIVLDPQAQSEWAGLLANELWYTEKSSFPVEEFTPTTLEPVGGVTSGSLAAGFDIQNFTGSGKEVWAIHHVTQNVTVGTGTTFTVQQGDLLLSMEGISTLTGTNGNLAVDKGDVFVFRPATPGDYSTGSFHMLLDGLGGSNEILGLSLVEQDITVGGQFLAEGSFLYSVKNGSGSKQVQHVTAIDGGATTTLNAPSLFLDGTVAGVGIDNDISGIHLVQNDLVLGDTSLTAGQMLMSVVASDTVGNNGVNVTKSDVFILDISSSTLADATLLFEGVESGGVADDVRSIALFIDANGAPTFGVGDGIVTTDAGFGDDRGWDVAIQDDGKIVVANWSFNGTDNEFLITRYNTDGTLDTTFGGTGSVTTDFGSGDDNPLSVVVQPDGKILVVGETHNGTDMDLAIVRYNADGTLDTSFDGDGKLTESLGPGLDSGHEVMVQADGKIVVSGLTHNGTDYDIFVRRYDSDGSVDTGFGTSGTATAGFGAGVDDYGRSMTLQPDGKIVLAGSLDNGGTYEFLVLRFNPDGTLDTSFDGDGRVTTSIASGHDIVRDVQIQDDGKIVVSGRSHNGANYDFSVVRYNVDGSLDTGFGTGGMVTTPIGSGDDHGEGLALQADGKILVTGSSYNGTDTDFALVRYNADGTFDTSFDGDGKVTQQLSAATDIGYSVAVQDDGQIVVSGITHNGTNFDSVVLRFNTDGTLNTAFDDDGAGILSGNPTFVENGSPVVLDSDVTIYDAELTVADNFAGATLTLERNGAPNSEDVFSATGTLSALTEGGNLVVGGTTIGTVTINSGGTLVLMFNSSATNALVDSTMQQIAYSNTSDTPPATAQIDWTFDDGNSGAQGSGGALQANGSITVNITATNDAPVQAINTGAMLAQGGTVTIDSTELRYDDPEQPPSSVTYTVTTAPVNGQLELTTNAGVAITSFTQAQIDAGQVVYVHDGSATTSDTFTFDVSDGVGGTLSAQTFALSIVADSGQSLWITAEQDVSAPSGWNGIDTEAVAASEILALGGSNLAFEPGMGTTDGTFSRMVDFDPMVVAGSSRVNALHVVGSNMTVGTNAISLQTGDVLFSLMESGTHTLQNSDLSTLDVQRNDIVIFRPDSPGNYSSGTYSILMDGSDLGLNALGAFTLVEQSTTVGQGGGATTLDAGDILLVDWSDVAADAHIQRLQPGTLGDNTAGTLSVLVDGNDLSADLSLGDIVGLDLVEQDIAIGGTLLQSGQILLTLYGGDDIGGTTVTGQDIVVLDVTTTGTNSAATASLLFDGSDVGLDAWEEDVRGLSLSPIYNHAPEITSNGGGAAANINVSENTTAVATVTATDADLDAVTYSIAGGTDAALFGIDSNSGVLNFNAAQNFENPADNNGDNVYVVVVTADDGKGGTDVQTISVRVTDIAEGIRITPTSVVPIGEETRVNTETGDVQQINAGIAQGLASDSNGNYVITWNSMLQDGDGWGVYAQLFSADGTTLANEFLVSTETSDNQMSPSVAMDDAGNFVIVWQSNLQLPDGDSYGVFAQRFDATGTAQGSEFLVNTTTTGYQGSAAIAMDADGDFVVTWVAYEDNSTLGIYAQCFDASGNPQGSEIHVNTYTAGHQQITSVDMDDAGNFVITWASENVDGSNYGVAGQLFNANGIAVGDEFIVNTITDNSQLYHDVAMLSDGRFVAEFQSRNADGTFDVYIQRFASDGTAIGSSIQVNTTTVQATDQPIGSITADDDGNITVAWNGHTDGDGVSVIARQFDWEGNPLTSEILVNQTTTGDQTYPEVVAQHGGGFIVAWSGNGTGDADGVFTQRYGLATIEGETSTSFEIVLESAPTAAVTIPLSVSDASEGSLSTTSVTFTSANWNVAQTVTVSGIQDYAFDGPQVFTVNIGPATSTDPNFNGLDPDDLVITNDDAANTPPQITSNGSSDTASINVAENTTGVTTVTASDLDGDTPTFSISGGADAALFAIDTNTGVLTFNSAPNFESATDANTDGVYEVEVTANDGNGGTDVQAISVTVTDANDDPVAVGDSFTAVEGVPYTASLGFDDLLLNDSDVDGDSLTVNTTPVSGPSNGALILNADGTFTYTPNNNFNGTDSFVYEVSDGNGGTAQATVTITVQPREIRILFTSQGDVNNSKVPGISSWDAGEVLGIGDPNLSFEPAGSDGSVLPYMDLEAFAASNDMTINGLHFVSNDITVGGANSVDLYRGDLLFVSDANDTMTSTNSLGINAGDVIVFRPDAAGDYTSGTFIHLLDQPGAAMTTGITLIENDVLIGDVTLQAGTFLFTQESVAEESSIYHFSADDVGAGTTTGTVSTLISSVDIDVNWNNFVGVMVISEDLYLDGTMVPAGSIVTTLSGGDSFVGDNGIEVNEDEIIYLTVTSTTMGSGTTAADATVLFDGGDIGLNNNSKKMRSLAIIEEITPVNNVDPVITLAPAFINYTEQDPPTIIDGGATLADPDSSDFDGGLLRVDLGATGFADDRLAINHEGNAAGQVGISGNTVSYGGVAIGTFTGGTDGSDPLTVLFNANADVASVEAVMQNITYENVSVNPDTAQRSVAFTISDGDGGTSATETKTIIINNVNAAPVITGANNLTAIDEDTFGNGGTLVSDLVSGWITDTDPAPVEGIAVVGVDNTNGSWEFSIDGGSTWTAFGAPSTNAATLLAANPDTFVRFVPDPNWNGTVTNGITFHAWDQTGGVNGDVVDLTLSDNVRDQFGTVSYANDDGSAVWTSGWSEFSDNGSAVSGHVRIESGKLRLDNLDGGAYESITRSADLSSAASAVLTFDYDGVGAGGLDTFVVEVSNDGGSTWTVMESIDVIGTVSGSKSYNLESFTALTADMELRLRIAAGFDGSGQHISFDNVDIAYSGTGIGGAASVSAATASSSITVNAVNDAPVMTAWYDAAWAERKMLSIDSTQVAGDVTDFPVLISLNVDADLATQALANGDDIIFTAGDGTTLLAHEIEYFNEVTGELRAWVKMDLSANVDTDLYMYYGNAAATNMENTAGVWSSNYVGVYHLGESPTGAAGELVDSSGSGNHATTEGGMNASDSVATSIGQGLAFDGVDDMLRIPDSASLDGLNDAATFSLWINWADAADGDHQIIMTSENRFSGGDGYEWASQGDGDHFFYPDATSPDGNYNLGPNPYTNGQWHHVAATMDYATSEVKIYVDGDEMTFTTEGVPSRWTDLSSSGDLLWGGNPDRATRYFLGMMDEIHLADVVRSQEWIQTEVNNQTNPGAFLSVGSAEVTLTPDTLTDIDEDDFNAPGDTVAAILGSVVSDRITDADSGAVEGIAVVGVDDTNGQWQYDAIADGTWVAFGAVTESSGVLLDPGAKIRFVPNADYNGPAGLLSFHAWDQTAGANGDTGVDVSVNGGTSAFSSTAYTASCNVNPVNDAPTGSVTISGTPAEDQTLTASNTLADADGMGAVSYQWQRDGVDIVGATGSTYTLGDVDVGAMITVVASYTDGEGAAESVTSAGVGPIINVNHLPTGSVSISGTATEDQTLTASNTLADVDGMGTVSYQWQRGGVDIAGATGNTYTLGDADVGATITVVASYTDGDGTAESVASAGVGPIANINDVPAGLPVITGTVTEDQTLIADTSGISDDDGLGAFSYQWLRDGAVIAGATNSTYTLGDTDVGTQISVQVTYTDAHSTAESVTSAQTAAVANINDNPVGLPVIAGTVTEDQTLTADTSGISDDDGLGAFSYQWLRDGAVIAGATNSTYTLGDADVGTQISVQVTYTDAHSTAESVTSAQTAAVANVNDAPTGSVTISGTPTEDQTLTASNTLADADGMGAVSYQWQRDGVDIAGATNSTYTLGDADVGTNITVVASYTDGHSTGESVTSAGVGPIANVNDAPTGSVAIDNMTPDEGDTLTASNTLADTDGMGVVTYQWQRNGVDIGGATGSTYTTVQADVGSVITVIATYTDGHGTLETIASAGTAAVGNVNNAPTGSVTISGTPTEDQTLTASNTLADVDGMGAVSYQWQRNGVDIVGATNATYTLGDADVGANITVIASYTDGGGTNESVASAGVGPIANINDVPAGLPVITGTVTEDQTLTADTSGISDDDGLGAFSYQWLRDGSIIAGATNSTYTLGDADVGTQISVQVTYTDAHSTAESVTSAQTAAVANVNDLPVGLPVITGTVTEDQTLTADTSGISDDDGLGVFSYQWLRDGAVIAGATNSTYTLGDADVGTQISVQVTYTDAHSTAESVTSAQTAAVANVNDAPTGSVEIDNMTPNEGDTLTASNTLADTDGMGIVTYQWQRDGVDIAGGTGSTYTTVQADVGTVVTVIATYTDGHGTLETVTSAATAAVGNVNNAPTGSVTISGTPTEDQTLTAANTLADVDGMGAVSYQWQRDGFDIVGATSNTYTLGDADVSATITVVASYTDGGGTAESVASAGVGPITNINDAPTGSVTISGTPTEDQTLTASNTLADDDGMGIVSYQWQRNGVDIVGATASTYTLGDADVGATITVIASYTDGHSTGESVSSASVGPIANVNDAPTGSVTISGTPTEDQTLTASNTLADDDGMGAVSYQWQRNGVDIAGATNSSYTLGDTDVGTNITVVASYTDGHSTSESVTSAAVGPIANVNDAPTGSVAIDNMTPDEGDTLTASNTLADTDGMGIVTYQWQRDGVDIAGGTGSTYTTVQADVGTAITVIATYTDGHGMLETVTSAATAAVGNVNNAPTGSVTISGMPTEDQTLTAANTLADADGMGAVSYQWQRDGVAIAGATASTYTLGDADVGATITVVASYTDGGSTNESVSSAGVGPIANINDVPAGLPVITGTVTEDQTLTADTSGISDDDGLGAFSYQWLRDGAVIVGVTNSTYTLGDADVGAQISVQVTYTDAHSTAESVTSAQTAAVANVNDNPVGLPVITGTVTEDQTLTADTSGISDDDGLGAFSYQWLRDGAVIVGATNSTYTLGDADVGTQISVQVTYTDAHSTAESVISAQTAPVANVNDAPAGVPVITGTATEDQTLTADASGISDADGLGAFSYQWLRNGVAIAGATSTTYMLGDVDVGTQISVQVTYTDGHGTAESVTSAQTTPVTNVNDPAVIGGTDTGTVTEDVDPDTDGLLEVSGSLTIIDPDTGEAMFNTGVFGGTFGVITLNANGDWDYAANTSQPAIQGLTMGDTLTDTITITSADGTTHDIVITIMGTNDAPVAGNDVASVNEGGSVIIDLTATDSDIDNTIDLNSIIITGLPANGSVVVNGDGTVTYTQNGSETLADSFTYTISDISGAVSNSATVTLTVTPVNDTPVAGDDSATVAEGSTVMIDLAANDSDAENALDLNSISIIGAPANGVLVVNGDGTVSYTHDGSETSSDSFTYTISDISGAISNTATVNITVTAVNDVPTTTGIADVTVNEDAAPSSVDLNAAFDDGDNLDSELMYSIVGNTNIGLFSIAGIDNSTGQLSLDYAADMNGSTQISIRATDPSGLSVDTLFTVTVTPVNDAPVIQANTGLLATGATPGTISSGELNVTDVDNVSSEITYTITALPANGTLLLNGVAMAVNDTFTQAELDTNQVAYQSTGTVPIDQFGFSVSDSAGGTVSNETFDIVVQVSQARDDSGVSEVTPSVDEVVEEETIKPEITESGSGGAVEGAGGYGGDSVPFGSASTPPAPAPAPAPVLSIEQPSIAEAEELRGFETLDKIDIAAEVEEYEVATFAAVQVESMEALWKAVDKMKDKIASSTVQESSSVELKVAAIESSSVVLSAGVVAWLLRSGALISSLLSNIPVWKGYDPLPVLMYKDDEEEGMEVEIDEDKIPTSLEELRKLKELKALKAKQVDVDSLFGSSTS